MIGRQSFNQAKISFGVLPEKGSRGQGTELWENAYHPDTGIPEPETTGFHPAVSFSQEFF
jgi:hypothetical protein